VAYVRFWHLADILYAPTNVCFDNGSSSYVPQEKNKDTQCPLWVKSGHLSARISRCPFYAERHHLSHKGVIGILA
jgi:hypothetical protein